MFNSYLTYFTNLKNLCIITVSTTYSRNLYIMSSSPPDRIHRFLFLPYHIPDTLSPSLLPRQSPITPRRSWSFPNPTRPVPSSLDSPHRQSSFPKPNPVSLFSPKQSPSLIFLPKPNPASIFSPKQSPILPVPSPNSTQVAPTAPVSPNCSCSYPKPSRPCQPQTVPNR